ncbi:MAG: hypothetical protein ACODAD_16325 [Planctomycetota bacterium]
MSFEDRLHQAVSRGQRRSEEEKNKAQARALTEEELKRLHSTYRLQLSEHIESCVKQLPNFFPGFRFETIFGERGWGAACSRDDVRMSDGKRQQNDYSRLELTVRPASSMHVLEVAGKATIRNKEIFNRNYFEKLEDVDLHEFLQLIDVWVIEYAELFAAKS